MPPEQINAPPPVQPEASMATTFWQRKAVWVPLAVVLVFGGGAYYVAYQLSLSQAIVSADKAIGVISNDEQTSTHNNFGIRFTKVSDYSQEKITAYGYDRCGSYTNINNALSFVDVDYRYRIADGQLFWRCETVGPIDASNLRQLNGPISGEVVLYDGKLVVIAGKVQPVLDPKTFVSVDHNGPDTFGGTEYFADSKAVYYFGGDSKFVKLPNADPSTFEIFERGPVQYVPEEGNTTARYAKDKNQAYYNGTVLPTKNPGEFGVFGNGSFAIDESSIYVYGKPIMTGIRKQDIEVHYSNRDEFYKYGGTLDFLIKRNDTNKWYHYKWSEKTLSEIAAPASTKIEARLFPQS